MIKNYVRNDKETVQVIIIFRLGSTFCYNQLRNLKKCFYLVKQKKIPTYFKKEIFGAKRGSSFDQSTNLKLCQ